MRHQTTKREIPTRPQREIVAATLANLVDARNRLEAYGIQFPEVSRLDQALHILSTAQTTGALVPAHRGDDLGLRALEFAFDYSAIAATLPAARVARVRQELEMSLRARWTAKTKTVAQSNYSHSSCAAQPSFEAASHPYTRHIPPPVAGRARTSTLRMESPSTASRSSGLACSTT